MTDIRASRQMYFLENSRKRRIVHLTGGNRPQKYDAYLYKRSVISQKPETPSVGQLLLLTNENYETMWLQRLLLPSHFFRIDNITHIPNVVLQDGNS